LHCRYNKDQAVWNNESPMDFDTIHLS
jgi:hypothetical protein